jgi:Ser/Thr protein kinase RdoA (MazF antagonist)
MKPYRELTRLGRLRRLRKLARLALEQYELPGGQLRFVQMGGNVVFRVDTQEAASSRGNLDPFVPNRYNLRVLATSNEKAVLGELAWLTALRDEAGLPVPNPVPARDGRLLTHITTPGVPQGKYVSLMRWVDGHHIGGSPCSAQMRTWGGLVAQLHSFSANWQPPEGFERFVWDWEGLMGNGQLEIPVDELVASMPVEFREPFQIVSARTREVMASFGKGPEAYGLIHADMYLENLLFKGNQPRLIDFEDCGFGYWMWDFGVIFSQWPWTEEFPRLRDAFFDGYTAVRTLPEVQFKHLELFMAAQCATMVLWSSAFIKNDPAMKDEYEPWRNKEGNKLLRYFEHN